MMAPVIPLAPQPGPAELPARFPSPFAPGPPHPLARRAADQLRAELAAGLARRGGADLDAPGGGKMFGVLVVATAGGEIGALRAFSGMLGERWEVDGFVPPVFDARARDAFWPGGEAELAVIDRELGAIAQGPERAAARAALDAIDARHAAGLAELAARHRASRDARRQSRAAIAAQVTSPEPASVEALHALAQASRADTAERRRLQAANAVEREGAARAVRALDERIERLEQHRAARSRQLHAQIWDGYELVNARGERMSLRAVFPDGAPPGGAADCAGPKLLAEAYRRGLRPVALAELWWGAPPVTGDRRAGVYYPACRGKCGAVLPWMLEGLPHEPAPLFGGDAIAADEPRAVYEDRWLVIVDKPCGLLSVPGRSGLLQDSVVTRLRRRYPDGPAPLVAHRLDLDTSGLLLAARDVETHARLQRLFARREIEKRYIAWLAGEITADHGEIALPLRVDLDDRPRQIHDPVHGKPAVTTWRVIARAPGRTRVALFPRTGRTHQLRVHAAHPLGLGAPIVGDRLYGDGDGRLLLHAEALRFIHPHTGAPIAVERPAPF